MDIKTCFERARALNDEVEELRYAVLEAWDTLECDRLEKRENSEGFFVYTDYKRLLDKRISELTRYRMNVLEVINGVSDTVLRTVLIARYINCKTWEQIADEIGYSDKWVRTRLHERALEAARMVG